MEPLPEHDGDEQIGVALGTMTARPSQADGRSRVRKPLKLVISRF
jgi:hypothetical protein